MLDNRVSDNSFFDKKFSPQSLPIMISGEYYDN
jgi:hypothetical protein